MSKKQKEEAKHQWILETQMFQMIAHGEHDSYEELAKAWDEFAGKKTGPQAQVIAENMKTQRVILQAAERAGKERKN